MKFLDVVPLARCADPDTPLPPHAVVVDPYPTTNREFEGSSRYSHHLRLRARRINAFLDNVDVGEHFVHGELEAYSCECSGLALVVQGVCGVEGPRGRLLLWRMFCARRTSFGFLCRSGALESTCCS